MSSPVSTFVVGGGALLASPALYAGFVAGTLPMSSALFRLTVAVLLVWLGVAALETLVSGTSSPADEPAAQEARVVEAHTPDSTPSGS